MIYEIVNEPSGTIIARFDSEESTLAYLEMIETNPKTHYVKQRLEETEIVEDTQNV